MLQEMGPPRIILGGQLVTIVAILARHLSSSVKQCLQCHIIGTHSRVFSFKVGDAFFCCHVSILSVLATPTWIATYRKTLYVKSPKGMERFFSFQNIHVE